MARTAVVKSLTELFMYAIVNPYTGNGLLKEVAVQDLHLPYDTGTGDFTVGLVVTSASGAVGTIQSITGVTASGTLVIDVITGVFLDGEAITDTSTGAAVVNGTPATYVGETTRDADDIYTVDDAEVVVRAVRSADGAGSNVVVTVARELAYDGQSANFTLEETVTGAGGATGVVAVDQDNGTDGILTLNDVTGTFVNDEVLTGSSTGIAVVNGILTDRKATFSDGDPPDEAKVVAISGDGLSTTTIANGVTGDKFEVLRGRPTYTSSNYVGYVSGKSEEGSDITIPIRDKGVIQHRKERAAGGERQITITADYLHDHYGILNFVDQDALLIFEREDDLAQVITEYHYYLQVRPPAKPTPDEAGGDDMSSIVVPMVFERAYTIAG